jgi:two-component system, response regulator PdtaR
MELRCRNPVVSGSMSISEPEPRPVVLVVEDDTLVRLFTSDFLDEAGFKVFEAVNADEALTVLSARPDVQAVLTDIEMSGSMNGIALAKVVRERWPGVRIVLISGRSNPGPDDHLPDGVAFLTKPFLPTTVVNLLRQIITPQIIDPASSAS